ncbi:NADPH-dependent ferric siderophore reductase [Rhizobium subbaraonis]|uniref:NADPH-dependent ferric siderophore reductase n=1 Tax=Rhizobium subbaraonis TaxID=908946 RepID=A0A285V3S7_9HYPH|nr:siderophore-interacting protein [Rhizobium subbaraonis]SOC48268.1 NADPH-dependent ferric siderophore reductase [Rhizobium subbaraonis]
MKQCYRAEVLDKHWLTPSMIRVEIGGGDMARFQSSGFPDEWVRLVFPADDGKVTMPRLVDDRWQMPADLPRSRLRPYTIRQVNKEATSVTVDFVVHDGGLASDWARLARPGDEIGVTSPQGKYAPPDEAEWIILIADATGLPATARILSEKKCNRPCLAHIEIPDMDDAQVDLDALCDMNWYTGFGSTPKATNLFEIAKSVQVPAGSGYVWVAGEAKATTAIRRLLAEERGMPKDFVTAIGYWILGKSRD